jgi:hypothetical protein
VEKLIYVVWKKPDASVERFAGEILGPVGRQMIAAGARALSADLADERAAFASALRMSRTAEPMSGIVSVWLDSALGRAPIEAALGAVAARLDGYLVSESVPLVNTTHVVPPGGRTPGFTTVALIARPEGMAHEAWREQWQGHHTRVAIETQSTFFYIQNLVVRALTDGAPSWAAIVEEGFPAEAANDPKVFYAADSDETLKRHQQRMAESVARFIDFQNFEWHPTSTYVLKSLV